QEPVGRQNFTLAHELAHLLYSEGTSACYMPLELRKVHNGEESKANRFAVELLLPAQELEVDFLRRDLPRTPSEEQLRPLARKWGVSVQALGYRLEELGLVSKGFTDQIVEGRPPFLRRPKTPAWERQLGRKFVETSIEGYQKGVISSSKLSSIFGVTVRKVLEEIEKRSTKTS
ncbi:MAG: ImmA/IrrE family metallo-endopeptidase, partial [Terriglobia bacterium]